LDGYSGRVLGSVLPAVDDDQGSEFAGFLIGTDNGLCRGEKNSGDEHNHADEGVSIVVSQTERQDDERRASPEECKKGARNEGCGASAAAGE
jgi:hypothetical protein